MNNTYVVCGCKPWNKRVFDEQISRLSGEWHYRGSKEDLAVENLRALAPSKIFFLHWSWIVPQEIINTFECINFHMTDLPYGRGGSPLQNLILRGHTKTMLTAHRMTDELDAGPIYLKEPLSLDGTAREILQRSSELAAEMIARIIQDRCIPQEQTGKVVLFERRTASQSEIPKNLSPKERYDFIRMLDCEGYPAAFETINGKHVAHTNARLSKGQLEFDIIIE
jgi:methionyl-tRNA formyltransferase